MKNKPNPLRLIELLQVILPEANLELEEIKKINPQAETYPKELLSQALKIYQKFREEKLIKAEETEKVEKVETLEEFKKTLFELIEAEAETAPIYLNYPEITPGLFEFWVEVKSFEASNEYIRKTLYGMPYNALKLLFCYRNKQAPLRDPKALRKNPALLFGKAEYAALLQVVNPALIFRALHLVRAIKKTNVFGAGTLGAEPLIEEESALEVLDFELIDELISAQFMKLYA